VIFPYRGFEVEESLAHPHTIIYRPYIPIRVYGPTRGDDYFASLDTGADETVMPTSVARDLGVRLDLKNPSGVRGVGGSVPGFYGNVDILVSKGKKSWRWGAKSLFLIEDSNDQTIRLGPIGFIEHFTIQLDSRRRRVDLRPTGRFPNHLIL
jgi:hypothetical protein